MAIIEEFEYSIDEEISARQATSIHITTRRTYLMFSFRLLTACSLPFTICEAESDQQVLNQLKQMSLHKVVTTASSSACMQACCRRNIILLPAL